MLPGPAFAHHRLLLAAALNSYKLQLIFPFAAPHRPGPGEKFTCGTPRRLLLVTSEVLDTSVRAGTSLPLAAIQEVALLNY